MSTVDTRTRLLETALELIWQSNYNSVGVNDICRQAGVTKGGFYHHFESKAALFCEASNHYWESTRKELDALMSPVHTPLQQLENVISFVLRTRFSEDPATAPGCPFFSAGIQSGCNEDAVNDNLLAMCQNGLKYNLALVRSLQTGGFLEGSGDPEQIARLISQYFQGATSFARVNRCLDTIRQDLPAAMYRLLGLKREYWFATKANWPESSDTEAALAKGGK